METDRSILNSTAALTGGIATGKSTVAEMFRKLGAEIIDTDLIARDVVRPGMPALERIEKVFGENFILPDGTLDREMMRKEIIGSRERRDLLNSITHPEIMEAVNSRIVSLLSNGKKLILVDVPLLFETGWEEFFSHVILVYVPPGKQVERLMNRDSIDRETAEKTLKAQMPIDEKKSKTELIIDNSGTLQNTEKQVKKIYSLIRV